ncbi:hypothetical protein C8R31_102499 [Nitrosospira sp. Nsp2]|nr:hypothetical protein C8R31_102499 [Nitrosospira sp. Nsp2]
MAASPCEEKKPVITLSKSATRFGGFFISELYPLPIRVRFSFAEDRFSCDLILIQSNLRPRKLSPPLVSIP